MMCRSLLLVAALLAAGPIGAQENGNGESRKVPPEKSVFTPPKPLPPGAPAPKIACATPKYEFGEVGQGEEIAHDFEIENKGQGELEIVGVDKSCGCTHAAAQKDRLKPGEKTLVNARVNTAGKQGPLLITINVRTNDPSTPTLPLTFTGKVALPFRPSVTEVNFGTIAKGATIEPRTFEILTSSAQTITEIKTDHDQVKAGYEIIPAEEKKQGFRVTVKVEGILPVGTLRAMIALGTTLAAQKTITIPVLAQVEGEISVKPRTSNFGKVKRGDPVTRTIEIEKAGSADLKIEGIEVKPEGAFSAKLEEVKPGQSYRVVLGLGPDAKDGYSRGSVTIKTNCPGETELQLYFYALVQP